MMHLPILLATALRVFVTPTGAGDMSGTSWATAMSSIAAAVSAVGESADGGEVWVQGGKYDVGTTMTLKANTQVIGGFKGNEDSVEDADPEANQTILTATARMDTQWDDGSPVWTSEDGKWTYHPPVGFSFVKACTGVTAFSDAEEGSPNCGICGLTFTLFNRTVVDFSHAGSDGLVVSKCCFLANNGSASSFSGQYVVHVDGSSAMVSDCVFQGGFNQLQFVGEGKTFLVSDSVFSVCRITSTVCSAGGLNVRGSSSVKVERCQFLRCKSEKISNTNNGFGTAVFLGGSTAATFDDCAFADSETYQCVRGLFVISSTGDVRLNRCRFTNNKAFYLTDINSYGSACITAQSGGFPFLRDSYFGYNSMTNAGGNISTLSSCLTSASESVAHRLTVLNCTFEHNYAATSVANKEKVGTLSSRLNTDGVIAHCLFYENDCLYTPVGGPAVRKPELAIFNGPGGGSSSTMFNTIMYNSATGYLPASVSTAPASDLSSPSRCGLSSVDIYNYTYLVKPGVRWDMGFHYEPLLSVDPVLENRSRTNENGLVSHGISHASPLRKIGMPLWLGKDDELYFYDTTLTGDSRVKGTNCWRRCNALVHPDKPAEQLTDAQDLELGLSFAAAPVPDAFGNPRTPGKIALGPLNAPKQGLTMLLR